METLNILEYIVENKKLSIIFSCTLAGFTVGVALATTKN